MRKERLKLVLCAIGAGALHGACVAALLPVLITLPGPGAIDPAPVVVDIEMLSPSPSVAITEPGDAQPSQPATAEPTPSDQVPAAATAGAGLSADVTSALPDVPQNPDPAPVDAAPGAETTGAIARPDAGAVPMAPASAESSPAPVESEDTEPSTSESGTVANVEPATPPPPLPVAKPDAPAATETPVQPKAERKVGKPAKGTRAAPKKGLLGLAKQQKPGSVTAAKDTTGLPSAGSFGLLLGSAPTPVPKAAQPKSKSTTAGR